MADIAEGKPLRVLVVDDEPSICRALEIVFSRAGYSVKVVETGKAAEDVLRGERVDCMIVDLLLKDTRGDVLFHLAKALQPHLARQTIMTTGDFTEYAQDLISACDCPQLDKPFELRDLLRMVEQIAGGAGARGVSA